MTSALASAVIAAATARGLRPRNSDIVPLPLRIGVTDAWNVSKAHGAAPKAGHSQMGAWRAHAADMRGCSRIPVRFRHRWRYVPEIAGADAAGPAAFAAHREV